MANDSLPGKIFPLFTAIGAMIIMVSFIIGALILAPLANNYFGDNTKTTRDGAGRDDSLTDDLVQLESWERWLEPLIVLGITTFMFGIALAFSTIPEILRERGSTMKKQYSKVVGGSK